MRRWFGVLVSQLLNEGENEKALKAAEKCLAEIPAYNVPHDDSSGSLDLARALLVNGKAQEGNEIVDAVMLSSRQYYLWYIALPDSQFRAFYSKCLLCINELYMAERMYLQLADKTEDEVARADYQQRAEAIDSDIQQLYQSFSTRCSTLGISV